MVAIFVAILFGFNIRYWRSRMINHLSVMYILLFCGCFLELSPFWWTAMLGLPGLITEQHLIHGMFRYHIRADDGVL